MTAPNMATIAASLERSMQNFSLNHPHRRRQTAAVDTGSRSSQGSTSDDAQQNTNQFSNDNNNQDTTLELNSSVSLPYHWEQCLDLKTGEIYYINWRNGMKAKEDPRLTTPPEYSGDGYYSDDDDNDDDSSYDSEESLTESSPSCSREREPYRNEQKESDEEKNKKEGDVLVVAGCKSCLMYYMVPKQHEVCPKCSGQLLHFDRSETDD